MCQHDFLRSQGVAGRGFCAFPPGRAPSFFSSMPDDTSPPIQCMPQPNPPTLIHTHFHIRTGEVIERTHNKYGVRTEPCRPSGERRSRRSRKGRRSRRGRKEEGARAPPRLMWRPRHQVAATATMIAAAAAAAVDGARGEYDRGRGAAGPGMEEEKEGGREGRRGAFCHPHYPIISVHVANPFDFPAILSSSKSTCTHAFLTTPSSLISSLTTHQNTAHTGEEAPSHHSPPPPPPKSLPPLPQKQTSTC